MPVLFLDCLTGMLELWQRVLRPEDPPIRVNIADGQPDGLPTLLDGFDICINDHTFFDADLLARCADLRHIVFLGTGASSFIDLAAAASRGIKVHTIRGYGDTSVAEHTIALAMAAARNVARMDRDVRAGRWRQIEGLQLYGKILGIIGLGGVGREVARIALGLGMQVLAWNRSPAAAPGVQVAALEQVLKAADILCVTLALNEETPRLPEPCPTGDDQTRRDFGQYCPSRHRRFWRARGAAALRAYPPCRDGCFRAGAAGRGRPFAGDGKRDPDRACGFHDAGGNDAHVAHRL